MLKKKRFCTAYEKRYFVTDLKWIKFDVRTFERAEFKYLASLDGGGEYILVWIKLLCEAAKRADGGRIYIFKNKKITTSELSVLLGVGEGVINSALCHFESFDLVRYDSEAGLVIKRFSSYLGDNISSFSDFLCVGAYEGERNSDKEKLESERTEREKYEEEKRERNREAQRRYRERQRAVRESKAGVKTDGKRDNKCVTEDNSKSNEGVILRNSESSCDVILSGNNGEISSTKNIFIEENRIDKSIIEKKKEENNNSSLSHAKCGNEKSQRSDNDISASLPLASEAGGYNLRYANRRGSGGYKKGSQTKSCEPKRRYADFDPEEAFLEALARTEREFCELNEASGS